MAKKQEENKKDKVYTATVSDLDMYLTTMMLTPIIDPEIGQHPSDPSCIWGVSVNLVGLNATMKSATVKSIGRRIGRAVYIVYAPVKQPEDLGGVVVPTPNGIVLECILPQARACIAGGGGILFIDEKSDARPATQAAFHSVLTDRQVGDYILPPKTRIFTAMNPVEYATVGHSLSSGIASRLAHVWCPPPTRLGWGNWVLGKQKATMPLDVGEAMVISNWNRFWPDTATLAAKFMESADDSMLHNQPKPTDPRSGGPWPNPRAWHYFVCARTAAKCIGAPSGIEFEIMETLMGPGVTDAWTAFVASADLAPFGDIIAGKWTLDKTRIDRVDMTMTSMCQSLKAIAKENRVEAASLAPAAWEQVQRVFKEGLADMAVRPAQELCLINLGPDCENQAARDASSQIIFNMSEKGYTTFA